MAGVKYRPLVGTAPRFVAPASGSSLSLGWSNDRSALTYIPLQPPKIFSCKVLWISFSCSTVQKVGKGHFSSKYLCPSAPESLLDPLRSLPFLSLFFWVWSPSFLGILHSVSQFLLFMPLCLVVIQNKPGKAWQYGQKNPRSGINLGKFNLGRRIPVVEKVTGKLNVDKMVSGLG